MNTSEFKTVSIGEIIQHHSKTLNKSICVPSAIQSYSLCIEYIRNWFVSKFPENTFKHIHIEGKNIFDDFRGLDKLDLIKRQKPNLTIIPNIELEFTNENIDSYPYGLGLYTQTGKFKESFFSCPETQSYMGIGMQTLLMPFSFRIKVETKAQQIDMYNFIKLACRVGFTCGENVDLDFHIPNELIIQIAKDNGFETYYKEEKDNEKESIRDVSAFLRWLNMHSSLPFLYKHRTLNGRNEFFIRMKGVYVHIRPGSLTADDGEREGQMTNNFAIDFSAEVRFPAPKFYAYYSDNAHELQKLYGAWFQPNGPVATCYTFKEIELPDYNDYHWPMFMTTTYENDNDSDILEIDLSELFVGDLLDCINDSINKGISPSIFCDIHFYNNGKYIPGNFNWSNLKFTSKIPVSKRNTAIAIYVDNDYLINYSTTNSDRKTRIITST